MNFGFEGQVAVVTGAGRGLGRSHALGLARRGARVAVVDLGANPSSAEAVAGEIVDAGGEALGFDVDVSDFAGVQAMVDSVIHRWGRVDILINNAGILRDRSFAKMDLADFRLVMEIHVMGAVHATKAVWNAMREQGYGRILLTSSSSGLYGNFGQANYATAKSALLGLMNTLHLEGATQDIRVNLLLPTAATKMTEGLLRPDVEEILTSESVTPGALFLVAPDAPSRVILSAGAGSFARTYVTETVGVHLSEADRTPENIALAFERISDAAGAETLTSAFQQTDKLVALALARFPSPKTTSGVA